MSGGARATRDLPRASCSPRPLRRGGEPPCRPRPPRERPPALSPHRQRLARGRRRRGSRRRGSAAPPRRVLRGGARSWRDARTGPAAVARCLEGPEVDRRNFDALNAIAVGYFELNFRAESDRGGDLYFADSPRRQPPRDTVARLRGRSDALRDAILDFSRTPRPATAEARDTAGRIVPIIQSLVRRGGSSAAGRIGKLVERVRSQGASPGGWCSRRPPSRIVSRSTQARIGPLRAAGRP